MSTTTQATPENKQAAPSSGKSSASKDGAILWTLWFRAGGNPHSQCLHFQFETVDPRRAYERGKLHCERMNYRFVKVEPFLVDLDHRENFLNQEG